MPAELRLLPTLAVHLLPLNADGQAHDDCTTS